jgi:hypothetical protein
MELTIIRDLNVPIAMARSMTALLTHYFQASGRSFAGSPKIWGAPGATSGPLSFKI